MTIKRLSLVLIAGAAPICAGCSGGGTSTPHEQEAVDAQRDANAGAEPQLPPIAGGEGAPGVGNEAAGANADAHNAAVAEPGAAPAADGGDAAEGAGAADPAMVREKAQVGVGKKGHNLGEGLVSTPVKAYFQTRERVVFEIEIPSTMNLYQAEHGRGPKTHDEFMEQIIKAGMIRLPELPEGHRYIYDPEKGELMVEHP